MIEKKACHFNDLFISPALKVVFAICLPRSQNLHKINILTGHFAVRSHCSGRSEGLTSDCSFIIYDQLGNVVLQKDQTIQFGLNQVDLNIASLKNGVYILEIKSPENISISRKKFSKL